MGDVCLDMLVEIRVTGVAFWCKGFPLVGERSFGDVINEGMATLVCMWWYKVSDDGWEGRSVMMRRDVGGRESRCVVGGNMVRRKGGYVLCCGEGIGGRVVFTFLFSRLVYVSFGALRHFLIFALLGGIYFYFPSKP